MKAAIMTNAPQSGAVLSHRWFRDGEGWAYHPVLKPVLPLLAEALAKELQDRHSLPSATWRTFRIPIRPGALFGIHALDSECLDPRAEGRKPSILIAAYSDRSKAEDAAWIISALKGLIPTAPGPDELLRVELPDMKNTKKAKATWRKWTVRSFIAAVLLVIGMTYYVKGQESEYARNQKSVRDAAREMLAAAGLPEFPDRSGEIWKAFHSVYGRREADIKSAHPDSQWLATLLDSPQSLQRSRPQWRHYVDALNHWAKERGLEQTVEIASSGGDAAALLRSIVATIDYRRWVEEQASGNPEFRKKFCTGLTEVNAADRRQAVMAQPGALGAEHWHSDYAEPMYEALSAWGVKEVIHADTFDRPWFVIHAFFAFLNRERFPADMGGLVPPSHEAFLARLPSKNLLHQVQFAVADRDSIDGLLEEMVAGLTDARPGLRLDVRSAIARIRQGMDYDQWWEQHIQGLEGEKRLAQERGDGNAYMAADIKIARLIESQSEPAPESDVAQFVGRFQRQRRVQ